MISNVVTFAKRAATSSPRRFVAGTFAMLALLVAPIGMSLVCGIGAALLLLAGMCVAFALLLGWE